MLSERAGTECHSEEFGPQEPSLSRLPLAPKNRLLHFERRTTLWLVGGAAAYLVTTAALLHAYNISWPRVLAIIAILAWTCAVVGRMFLAQLMRPLQTLANVVAAIREEDYSFRVRGARRGDTVGDLALEINSLSGTLQAQRATTQDALALLERVLTSMLSPVLAFDDGGRVRLLNEAAQQTFALDPAHTVGRSANELGIVGLLSVPDQGLFPASPSTTAADTFTSSASRWSVRRTTFRLQGVPHTLIVLSDVAAVLKEEERLAWQRLIRVLSHEINNSLTPIQSIAGSLRLRVHTSPPQVAHEQACAEEDRADFERGLCVIEERAASLNRFLQAYQRLTHLPAPVLQAVPIADLVRTTAPLERRLPITVIEGPTISLRCDPDQIQQALINLLQNAVDAALMPESAGDEHVPEVVLTWVVSPSEVQINIEDNGPGVNNPTNLFVPFYTTKPHGSGIGLALVQQIASGHGGRITLTSKEAGRGSKASLHLPLHQAHRAHRDGLPQKRR